MPHRRPPAPGLSGPLLAARSVLDVVNALNAERPLDRRHRAALACFALGWPTSEVPLAELALEVALTARAVRRGALRTRSGRVGAALQVVAWAQLARVRRQAAAAGPVLDAALTDALGPGYTVEHPWAGAASSPGVLGTALRSRRSYVAGDVERYGAHHRQVLDIWRHRDLRPGAGAPVLIQVHGGAWVTGDRKVQAYPLMGRMASLGWVCVPISYRLAPRHRWPAQIEDVKRAIGWVKAHIADFGGDPDFVCLTGGSAGGHLSSLAALTAGDPAFQPGFEDVDTSVRAVVPFYGAYDFTGRDRTGHPALVEFIEDRVVGVPRAGNEALYEAASPMSRVHPGAPPFFVLHGTNDSLVPVEHGDAFVDLLRAVATQPVAYARVPGGQHAFDLFGSPRGHATASAVADFLGHVWAGHRATSTPR